MTKPNNRPITAKLRTKGDRYYGVFYCKDKNGNPKEIWRSLDIQAKPGNKRKAEIRMEEMKQELRGVVDVPGYGIAFVDYLQSWKERKEVDVDPNTFQSIVGYVNNKIVPYFTPANLRLSEVKPKHIRLFYDYLFKNGRSDGTGGLSISSLKRYKSILNEVFKQAFVEKLILTNPVESVKLPAKDNPRKPYTVLNQELANKFLGYVKDDNLMYPLLLLTLNYGLRKSEALGLKWSAIDFKRNTLKIESVITQGKVKEKNKTKTQSSNTTFPLLPDIKEILMIRRCEQERNRAEFGEKYVETDYVFTNPKGNHLNPNWVTREFQKALSACGLPKMRYHELRHSTACILYERGMGIIELQHWMRHSKTEMTADVYLHISKERENRLADGLQNMLSEDNKTDIDTDYRIFFA